MSKENDVHNQRRYVIDGDRVKHDLDRRCGRSFAENKAREWLVVWDDGTVSITHESFLKRDI